MAGRRRVVVVGGGVAGLEALMALRALGGRRLELTLIAPGEEFAYNPLSVDAPFAVGRPRRIRLYDAAREAGAAFLPSTVEAVDADQRTVSPVESHPLGYDALVLAAGAEAVPAVAHATTWDDRLDAETVGGLLQDFELGYSRRLAIVIPPGPVWPLRAYELALFITLQAEGMSIDLETTIVAPEPSPLALLGSRALELVSDELELAGVTLVSDSDAEVEPGHAATVVLHSSGRRLEVDRVLALPRLRGRPVTGIPTDADGFIEVDEHCRVRGLDGVWAAGDGTAFPLKSGGVAAEQADVAATDIAAAAGAAVEPRPFDPEPPDLAGLPAGRFLAAWLGNAEDEGLTTLSYLRRDLAAGWRGRR
jgi:sulfide:quinone oxidoreductase